MTAHTQQDLAVAGLALTLLVGPRMAAPASAQERPGPAVEFAAGALFFPDDGTVTEGFVGGTARFYVSPRVSLGPEFAYVSGEGHSHLMLTGNVTFDVVGPENGRPRRLTPYVVGGGGIFRTREEFSTGPYWSGDPAFTAGGGFRARLGQSVFAGAEARIGWELHIRLNGIVGVRF
jgi:hypothetical protein